MLSQYRPEELVLFGKKDEAKWKQPHADQLNDIAASDHRFEMTLALLGLRVAKLVASVRRQEKRLNRSHRRI
ncbi:MAG TPA: hypothetical protein VFB04_09640 [Terriglobales bacterium]|nr:hypothetical protein [Terriglobales bacterium]